MNLLKSKWSHLYQFGYPVKPFPTNYESDLEVAKKAYNQCLEDNKDRKYTEENLKVLQELVNKGYASYDCAPHLQVLRLMKAIDTFIQSIQPKTEWDVAFDENNKLKLV